MNQFGSALKQGWYAVEVRIIPPDSTAPERFVLLSVKPVPAIWHSQQLSYN